jgi:hypothetical protein
LDGILETTRPILNKHGLAIIQEVRGVEGAAQVKTKLIHESGSIIETDVLEMKPVKANDPQAMGSCITYMKRYQLAALLGICESVDDDGNQATYGTGYNAKNKKDDKKGTTGAINEAQIKRLYAIAHSKNVDRAAVDSLTFKKFKKKVEALTKEEYDFMCDGYAKM